MNAPGTAIITGAASGIGAEFARQLSAAGHDLLVIDKSRDPLESIAADLAARHSIVVESLVADLSDPIQLRRVEQRVFAIEQPALLINAAGFGTTGRFAEIDVERQIEMINVHVVAGVRLCRAVLPRMVSRDRGGIVNVCSISALTRFPESATYSATKAYMLTFTEILGIELEGTRIRVQALCPGLTRTRFIDTPEMQRFDRHRLPDWMWMDPADVTGASLKALRHGPVRYIPGLANRFYVFVFGNTIAIALLAGYRRARAHLKANVPGFRWLP
ncbi:MAG: SDR family oxidoreductase [Acidobacteria bacterium]|nr:SDR family oxidoreductase [Acidobacteriota bacterium]